MFLWNRTKRLKIGISCLCLMMVLCGCTPITSEPLPTSQAKPDIYIIPPSNMSQDSLQKLAQEIHSNFKDSKGIGWVSSVAQLRSLSEKDQLTQETYDQTQKSMKTYKAQVACIDGGAVIYIAIDPSILKIFETDPDACGDVTPKAICVRPMGNPPDNPECPTSFQKVK